MTRDLIPGKRSRESRKVTARSHLKHEARACSYEGSPPDSPSEETPQQGQTCQANSTGLLAFAEGQGAALKNSDSYASYPYVAFSAFPVTVLHGDRLCVCRPEASLKCHSSGGIHCLGLFLGHGLADEAQLAGQLPRGISGLPLQQWTYKQGPHLLFSM